MDRVALKYTLNTLDEKETRELIEFRLRTAGYRGEYDLFTGEAIGLIYQHTQGYPRRIAMLCHDALEEAVMREVVRIDRVLIQHLVSLPEPVHEGQYCS